MVSVARRLSLDRRHAGDWTDCCCAVHTHTRAPHHDVTPRTVTETMSNIYGFQFLQQVEERGPARQVRGGGLVWCGMMGWRVRVVVCGLTIARTHARTHAHL